MKRLKNIDDGLWLVVIAAVVTVLALKYPKSLDLSQSELLILGLLSGAIYSLTNANDTRAVHGRQVVGETAPFLENDFLAVGGLLGVMVVWIMLPPIYRSLASEHAYVADLPSDLWLAFTAGFPVLGFVLPSAFLFSGLFTFLSTFATLKIFKMKSLDFYAILLAVLMGANLASGPILFNETIPAFEITVLVALILLIPVLFFLMPKGGSQSLSPSSSSRLPLWAWVLIFLVCTFLRDVSVRAALLPWENTTQHFFVSLCFRPAYFSFFLVWFFYWTFWERKKTRQTFTPKLLGLPLVSAITVSLAFVLGTPVMAKSLSKGPLTIQVGNILLLSIIGVLYRTDGTRPNLRERLAEVYVRQGQQKGRYLYLAVYMLFVVLVTAWLFARYLA